MATDGSRKRRAGTVCVACHSRKIKCDLQQQQSTPCSKCAAAQRECIPRKSNRNKHPRSLRRVATPSRPPPSSRQESEAFQNASAPSTSGGAAGGGAVVDTDLGRQSFGDMDTPPANMVLSQSLGAGNNPPEAVRKSYFGQTGFLQVYSPETELDAAEQHAQDPQIHRDLQLPSPNLQQSFVESYYEHCYTWCPVLDRDSLADELNWSPLLLCALSLAASHVQPPLIAHPGPAVYYAQAKELFDGDHEANPILCLKAITLLYWWSPRPPTTLHKNSSWWWTSAAIRYAQQLGLHRELTPEQQRKSGIDPRVQRRIWWTLFSRERLTAVCQSRPAIIDPSDCSIREICVEDFPDPSDQRAEVFVHWVRLCEIIGRIAKFLSRPPEPISGMPFPSSLIDELINWVHSLPERLKLPIGQSTTTSFSRDVHQLHLPYLSVVIILNLHRSSGPPPQAYAAAMMAATSMARIYRDLLERGTTRFLLPISCWYSGMAFLALLQARRIARFQPYADSDIEIIGAVLKQLQMMWPTANIFISGIGRLLNSHMGQEHSDYLAADPNDASYVHTSSQEAAVGGNDANSLTRYFPWTTSHTSRLAHELLEDEHQNQSLLLQSENWGDSVAFQLQDLFEPFDPFLELMPTL